MLAFSRPAAKLINTAQLVSTGTGTYTSAFIVHGIRWLAVSFRPLPV
jgi:hypothetical protein